MTDTRTTYTASRRFTRDSILAEGPADAMTLGERLALEWGRARDDLDDQLRDVGLSLVKHPIDAITVTVEVSA